MNDFETEWQKMLNGEPYEAGRREFYDLLVRTRMIIKEYNETAPDNAGRLTEILRGLLGSCGERVTMNQPFRCDYGCNIHVGEDFIANFNFTVLDEARVTIGDHAFIGPNVSIYTACHPLDPTERAKFTEWAEPVTIGDNVWIGGSVTILPGVTIGNNVVVGAGSVVAKDLPDNVVAVGNPARIVKHI